MKVTKIIILAVTLVLASLTLVSCTNTDVETDSTKTFIEHQLRII